MLILMPCKMHNSEFGLLIPLFSSSKIKTSPLLFYVGIRTEDSTEKSRFYHQKWIHAKGLGKHQPCHRLVQVRTQRRQVSGYPCLPTERCVWPRRVELALGQAGDMVHKREPPPPTPVALPPIKRSIRATLQVADSSLGQALAFQGVFWKCQLLACSKCFVWSLAVSLGSARTAACSMES